MRVFLVDDEFLQRALVKKTVDWNSLGMEICGEAEDGEEALKKILEEKPDILIMDINIPYMNGIEVSKKVKVIFPEIQVIILTAYGEFEYAQNAISLGVQEYLLKPVKLDAFKALFEKIIEICQEKEIEKKNRNDIIQAKEEAAQQKLSWNLLNYLESEELEEGTLNHWETLENEFTSVVQEKNLYTCNYFLLF